MSGRCESGLLEPQPARAESYFNPIDTGIAKHIRPEELAQLVEQSLRDPDTYLNEGFGRYLLGALRRYRLNLAVNNRANKGDISDAAYLQDLLLSDPNVINLTGTRLGQYGNQPPDVWRAIWVIYVIEQQQQKARFANQLAAIEKDPNMPLVAKLWARRCRTGVGGEPAKLSDELHDMSYIDAGRKCYGGQPCKDVGS